MQFLDNNNIFTSFHMQTKLSQSSRLRLCLLIYPNRVQRYERQHLKANRKKRTEMKEGCCELIMSVVITWPVLLLVIVSQSGHQCCLMGAAAAALVRLKPCYIFLFFSNHKRRHQSPLIFYRAHRKLSRCVDSLQI